MIIIVINIYNIVINLKNEKMHLSIYHIDQHTMFNLYR